jgi:Fur family ferric uptake transcriptional regulator
VTPSEYSEYFPSRSQCHLQVQGVASASYTGAVERPSPESVLQLLRVHGLRMTPQRRAIIAEVMAANGHISPTIIAQRVRDRVPGVDASTVYRTLDLLEQIGVLSHTHLESGAEYHRRSESQHVHLVCSNCGAEDSLSLAEAKRLRDLVAGHHGFAPDLTHFAISGLCRHCQDRTAAH